MKNKLLTAISAAALAASVLAGCGNSSEETVGTTTEESAAGERVEEETTDEETAVEDDSSEFVGEGLNEATVLRVGYQPKFGDPIIALEQKYHYLEEELAEDDISLELYSFENGPALLEALTAGGIDVGDALGDSPFTTATAAGYPIIGIAAGLVDDTQNSTCILTDAGTGITNIEDLKGKNVAVSIGTSGHFFLVKALELAGLTTDDVNLINLTDSEYLAAFEGDSIDAAVTSLSLALTIEDTGAADVLDIEHIELAKSVFVANSDFADKNPEIVAIYLKAVLHYYDYFAENRDEVQELTAETFEIPASSLESYQNYTFDIELDDNFYERLQGTIDFLVDQETIEGLNSYAVTDSKYQEEAERLLAVDEE